MSGAPTSVAYAELVNEILPGFRYMSTRCGKMAGMPKTLPAVDMSEPVCCSPMAAGPIDDDAALDVALRLKALADPVRVKLVSLLFNSDSGAVCGCDLATAVELSESTASHHLAQLR